MPRLKIKLSSNDSRGQRLPIALRLSARVLGTFSRTSCFRISCTLTGLLLRQLSNLRKEVIQPHLPIRLPCYDFTPVTFPTLDGCAGFGCERLPWCDGRCVQDPGTYSPQYADLRLLAIPTSCRRVAACNPNWETVFEVRLPSRVRCSLSVPL